MGALSLALVFVLDLVTDWRRGSLNKPVGKPLLGLMNLDS